MSGPQETEAGQEVKDLQAESEAAATSLEQAQVEQKHCSESLFSLWGPLSGHAARLRAALISLLGVLPHAEEIGDAGTALLDLRKFTQACEWADVNGLNGPMSLSALFSAPVIMSPVPLHDLAGCL